MPSDRLLIRDTTFPPTHRHHLALNLPTPNSRVSNVTVHPTMHAAPTVPPQGRQKKRMHPHSPISRCIHELYQLTPRLQPRHALPILSGRGQNIHSTFHKPQPQIDWAGSNARQPTPHHLSKAGPNMCERETEERLERKKKGSGPGAHGGEGGDRDANDRKRLAVAGCKNLFFGGECHYTLCHYASRRMHLLGRPVLLGPGLVWRAVRVSLPGGRKWKVTAGELGSRVVVSGEEKDGAARLPACLWWVGGEITRARLVTAGENV